MKPERERGRVAPEEREVCQILAARWPVTISFGRLESSPLAFRPWFGAGPALCWEELGAQGDVPLGSWLVRSCQLTGQGLV